jgi:hypothetical protein
MASWHTITTLRLLLIIIDHICKRGWWLPLKIVTSNILHDWGFLITAFLTCSNTVATIYLSLIFINCNCTRGRWLQLKIVCGTSLYNWSFFINAFLTGSKLMASLAYHFHYLLVAYSSQPHLHERVVVATFIAEASLSTPSWQVATHPVPSLMIGLRRTDNAAAEEGLGAKIGPHLARHLLGCQRYQT